MPKPIVAKKGGNSFEIVSPTKLHGRKLAAEERNGPHAVGIPGTGFAIPGTQVNKQTGERAYEMPLFGSSPGNSRKTIAIHQHGETPYVLKIERNPFSYLDKKYVFQVRVMQDAINRLVPSAKQLPGFWLEHIDWGGQGTKHLWVSKSEWAGDKNLAETSFADEKDFVATVGGVADSVLTLFDHDILYHDVKPEDFCPGRTHDKPILVDEENGMFRTVYHDNSEHKQLAEGLVRFVMQMCERHSYVTTKDTLKLVERVIKSAARKNLEPEGDLGEFITQFDKKLAYQLSRSTGQPTLYQFGKKKRP